MNRKCVVLAGLLSVAAVSPAAAGDGWYLGLGAGWASQNPVDLQELTAPFDSGQVSTKDGLLIAGALGFKFPGIPARVEFESGYDFHSISSFESGGTSSYPTGRNNIASELVNAVYDFPIAPLWNISVGGGIGEGHVYFSPRLSDINDQIAYINHWSLMWQGIAGVSFEIAPDADLFVDYRYRSSRASDAVSTPGFGTVDAHESSESVVMAGVRFYLFPAVPVP